MAQYSYNPTCSLAPDAVATAIAELVTEEKYGGGTVMWITMAGKEVADFASFDKEMAEKAYGVDTKGDRKTLEEAEGKKY